MLLNHLLSLLIWVPIFGGILLLIAGGERYPKRACMIAIITAVLSLLLCVPLYLKFDLTTYAMQFQEHIPWIEAYGINYDLGVDGISMPFILLSTFTTLIVVLIGCQSIKVHVAQYMAAFLIMQGMMVGVFAALDSILFYIFWEAILIPMYLAIGIWGSANRSYASIKFFLYTFVGSALFLVVLLYLRAKTGSFAILDFYPVKLDLTTQIWIFLAFLLGFAIKMPMWPVHTWLPDAHTEAPAGGSVILAALMLKLGGYGFLRFSLPITPDASHALAWLMIILSLIAIVYIGFIAIVQADMKKLIAYSSIAHMGFATLGCFMIYPIIANTGNHEDAYLSLEGAMFQMISHAFISGALFIGVGILYDRLHTRMIQDFGGVVHSMPLFATMFMLFAMANVGLPGTSGFVGEFMVILSAFQANIWISVIAATTLMLGAAYTLWMYKRVFFGEVASTAVAELKEITGIEKSMLILMAIFVIWLGVYPHVLLELMDTTIGHLTNLALVSKL